jgi:hypothetical protein
MDHGPPFIHQYELATDKNNINDNSILHLQPNHTHFHFFDDGKEENGGTNDVKNMLLKRQEIEHELSINKSLMTPIAGYEPKMTRMYFKY